MSKEAKRRHTFSVLSEWPSAREQLKLEKMYNPELGVDLEQKFFANQQFHALKVYEKIGAESRHCLERFWNGMERWMNFQWKHPPIFHALKATVWTLLKKNSVIQLTLIFCQINTGI